MPAQFQLHRRILQLRTCMHVQMYKKESKKPDRNRDGKNEKVFPEQE